MSTPDGYSVELEALAADAPLPWHADPADPCRIVDAEGAGVARAETGEGRDVDTGPAIVTIILHAVHALRRPVAGPPGVIFHHPV